MINNSDILEKRLKEIEQEVKKEILLEPISLANFLEQKFSSSGWIIQSLVPADSIVVFSGDPCSYKTWIALSIAKAVASGKPLFDKFSVSQRNVLVIDEDNSSRSLNQMLQKLKVNPNLPIYILTQKGFRIDKKNCLEALIKAIEKLNIGLIIFDSLVRIHRKDENNAQEMASIFGKIRKLTEKGISIVIIHHHRKHSFLASQRHTQILRGSSDILAAVDCHLAVERNNSSLIISQTKLREEKEIKPFQLEIIDENGELKINYCGECQNKKNKKEKAEELIFGFINEKRKASRKEIIEFVTNTGIGEKTVIAALDKLKKDERIVLESRKGQGGGHIYAQK